jgi:hypothetical protein
MPPLANNCYWPYGPGCRSVLSSIPYGDWKML